MKKSIKIIFPVIILIIVSFSIVNSKLLIGSKKNIIAEYTWNQLSVSEKSEIINSFKDASIRIITADKNSESYHMTNEDFDGKRIYVVTFKSKEKDLNGNVVKLVDMDNYNIIGYYFRN